MADIVTTTDYNAVVADIKNIITTGQNAAYAATNKAMIMTYWNIGRRIVECEQNGSNRAEYGTNLLNKLAEDLTSEFGKNYSARNLRNFRKLYEYFRDIEIWNACVPNLTWTHFRTLLRVEDETARLWYMNEASKAGWSARALDRNIATQYYYRLLQAPDKDAIIAEMQGKTAGSPGGIAGIIKSPMVAEFLGFRGEQSYLKATSSASCSTATSPRK